MPWPRAVARLNKRYTNRFIEPLVKRFAGYTLVTHRGRRSGVTYRTPVYSFEADGSFIVALTYGSGADWAQNVLADRGSFERGGVRVDIAEVTVVGRGVAWPHLPVLTRAALRVLNVRDFLQIEVRPRK